MPDEPRNVQGEQILKQLREADETTLRFSPWGLGGRLEPAVSAAYLAELMSHACLVDTVPEDVRLSFERVRTVFMHGLLDYDLFTAAYSLGHLVLEGALRTRFITYYEGGIPILRDGTKEVLPFPASPGITTHYDSRVSAAKSCSWSATSQSRCRRATRACTPGRSAAGS